MNSSALGVFMVSVFVGAMLYMLAREWKGKAAIVFLVGAGCAFLFAFMAAIAFVVS